jgi:hypothetical protein
MSSSAVSGSTSQNTGSAPVLRIALTVGTAVFATVSHFVAGTDAERTQRDRERIGARC